MERVDQVKIAPHEPVAAVHAGKAALGDAGPGIKLAARCKTILLKQFRGHTAWLKGNPVVAIALVQPPLFIKQPAFILEPLVEWCAGERGKMIKRRNIKRMFHRKIDSFGKAFRRIAVVAEDKSAIDADVVLAEIREGFFKAPFHRIEGLVHVLEVCGTQTFEAYEHALAAAAHEQFQEFFVVRRVDAGLAYPTDLQRNQGAEKLLRLIEVRSNVIIYEEKQFSFTFQWFQFGNDVVNGAACLGGIEDRLHGAKVAFEMAATSGLNQPDGQITLAAKDGTVGLQSLERSTARLTVKLFEPMVPGIIN